MPILNGPMSITQLKAWAETKRTVAECKDAMLQIDRDDPHEPRRVSSKRI